MDKKDDKEKNFSTDSGEFVPSYFTWQTLTGQKHRAKELNEMTKKKDEN